MADGGGAGTDGETWQCLHVTVRVTVSVPIRGLITPWRSGLVIVGEKWGGLQPLPQDRKSCLVQGLFPEASRWRGDGGSSLCPHVVPPSVAVSISLLLLGCSMSGGSPVGSGRTPFGRNRLTPRLQISWRVRLSQHVSPSPEALG